MVGRMRAAVNGAGDGRRIGLGKTGDGVGRERHQRSTPSRSKMRWTMATAPA